MRRALPALLAVGSVALAAACSGDPAPGAAPSVSAPTAASTAPGTRAPSEPSAPTRVTAIRDVATNLATPWAMARLDDGSYLISLRDQARVVRVSPRGTVTPVPGTGAGGRIAGVAPGGEGGLLGITFAPGDTATLYAYFTSSSDNRVVAMPYTGDRLGPLRPLVTGIPKAGNHNGGRLAFGPDGMLYVTTGDAENSALAQDRGSLAGKILRVTRSGAPAPGNPFPGSRVWSYGHRNVQGIGWDGSGRMYASEFGQNAWDELNRIEPGKNYGWPAVEGMGGPADVARGFTPPLRVWATSEASPSGMAVGRGAIWMAALRGERLWRIPLADNGSIGTPVSLLSGRFGRLRAVAFDTDGSLLIITNNQSRGTPRAGDDRLVRLSLG